MKPMSLWLFIAAAGLLAGCQAVRGGYESAPYKIVRSDGRAEVRHYGYFDPPWTPSFLRRNEVMLRIGGGK